MCLLIYIHTSESEIFNQSVTVGKDISLVCKHEGKVTWSKDRNGTRVDILTAETDGETIKLISDPHNRYSVLDDLSLHIKSVSDSDSGIYYCNAAPTVNLIVTEPGATTSNDRQPGATTPTQETTTSNYSQPGATTPTTVISTNTTQPNSTQSNSSNSKFTSTKETTKSNYSQPGATTPTTAKPKTIVDSVNKSVTNSSATKHKPTYITPAVSGGVVFLVLILLLWACIKRKSLSAALSNKKDNIYETVDDSHSTVQPAPPQKTNDAIYYLAGDPDVVKLGKDGQRHEFDDPTYTLIGLSESKSKENLNEQGPDVPLYSTIKESSE
nr:uncharacterized protein LOC129436619 [Misgurnus anguillicaudatus]